MIMLASLPHRGTYERAFFVIVLSFICCLSFSYLVQSLCHHVATKLTYIHPWALATHLPQLQSFFSLEDVKQSLYNILQKNYRPQNEFENSLIEHLSSLNIPLPLSTSLSTPSALFHSRSAFNVKGFNLAVIGNHHEWRSNSVDLGDDFISLIKPEIDLMWECEVHIPLYLFQEDVEYKVSIHARSDDWRVEVLQNDGFDTSVEPMKILNVSMLARNEYELTLKEWSKTYRRFLHYLRRSQKGSATLDHWQKHYYFRLARNDTGYDWRIVLTFDITERQTWMTAKHAFDQEEYISRWKTCYRHFSHGWSEAQRNEPWAKTAILDTWLAHLSRPSLQKNHGQRYRPYSPVGTEHTQHPSSSSFNSRAHRRTKSTSMCLVCGAQPCLIDTAGNKLCFTWNITGSCTLKYGSKCSRNHGCSLCGSCSHNALAFAAKVT